MPMLLKLCLPLVCLAGCAQPGDDKAPSPDERQAKSPAEPSVRKKEGQPYDFSKDLTPDKARALLPQAASLTNQEFQEILDQPPLQLDEIENQSLTALLLAVDPDFALRQNQRVRGEFHYVGSPFVTPKPDLLRAGLQSDSRSQYVSVIQPEYITECTCLTRGNTANGRVAFQATSLYSGQANFTARRRDEDWQIVAFHMPEYGLMTELQPNGKWQLVSEDSLLGIEYP